MVDFSNERRGLCVACGQMPPGPTNKLTCSQECHDALVTHLEGKFGTHKIVVRQATGEEFLVPTRDIIEQGLREQDLDRYPRWVEDPDGKN